MPVLSPMIAELVDDRLMPLGPGTPNPAAYDLLRGLTPESLFVGQAIKNTDAANGCLAGLWLLHNYLDESHALSQNIATPDGSWWHAIMHRREPDPSNSKYWFRRIGNHPILSQLVQQAPALGYQFANSERFVDFCERARDTDSADKDIAQRVQRLEWQLLFAQCANLAVS